METAKETVTKKFPKFNIEMKVPKNTNAIELAKGDILITDRGTYRYLQCIQTNPNWAAKDVFGFLISRGTQGYPINEQLPNMPSSYIVATKNYERVALRFIFDNGNTDISLYGGGPLVSKQDVKDEVESLLEIMETVTFLSNY
ncbi:MAG: hypothetical protein V7K92_27580 [Nostoc sp.]|uniref:hypothetical protein n=1 Tax=Nostoc sp. TaxID=1180 RepID=UPI002FEF8D30